MKVSGVVILLLLATGGAGAPSCDGRQASGGLKADPVKKENASATPEPRRGGEGGEKVEIKTLAEGSYGPVEDAFLVVARDAEGYAALRRLVENLPEQGTDFFGKNTVVAAFLGTRPTGGYAVEIAGEGQDVLLVTERTPPRDAITTQALTAPFKVVSVPVGDAQPLQLRLAGAWEAALRPYRLTRGEFTTGGGFAGRMEKLQLDGTLRVMRRDNLATFLFDIGGTGGKAGRALKGAATGVVGQGGIVTIPSMDAGTLVDQPRSPLRASGKFDEGEGQLSLRFESLPARVDDGFGGQGVVEAEATGPPPKKNESTGAS